MTPPLIIDQLNLRLPRGWRGDPTRLARRIAEQLQLQAAELQSAKRIELHLQGPFAGVDQRVSRALAPQLRQRLVQTTNGRRDET